MATISKRKINKLSTEEVKRFKALRFDILDDHHDQHEHRNEDLNHYFTSPTIYPVTNFVHDSIVVELVLDDNEEVEEEDQQEQLSQKMNELSMKQQKRPLASPSSPTTSHKKLKVSDESVKEEIVYDKIMDLEQIEDEIPTYLMPENSLFEKKMKKILENQASVISLDDLRQLALIKHRGIEYEQRKRLFLVYLRAVKGTLKETWSESLAIDRHYVAPEIRSMMKKNEIDTTDYRVYESFLQESIVQIDDKLADCHEQLKVSKKKCLRLTTAIEEAIDDIIDNEAMKHRRMTYDAQITLVECDYDATILERKFLAEKPTRTQLEEAHRLYDLQFEFEKARRILMEWKQSIFEQCAPKELQASMLSIVNNLQIESLTSTMTTNRYEQLVRQRLTEFMTERIVEAEQNFYLSRNRLNTEIDKVWKEHHDQQSNQAMPECLTGLIEIRFINITNRLRIIYNYRMNSPKHTPAEFMGFGRCTVIHTSHPFKQQQLQLLNRGPTYVIPCQLFSVSPSPSVGSEMLKELYGPLKQQLTRLFAKHQVNIALSMDLQNKLRQQFDENFTQAIPNDLRQRSSDEKKVMSSIRRHLLGEKSNLILRRTADNTNTFYLGNAKEFNEKGTDFIAKSDQYEFQMFIDEKKYGTEWQDDVRRMIDSMNYMLRRIHEKKGIDDDLLKRLTVDPSTVKLPYLYFLPHIDQDQTLSMMPIIVAYESPTWLLGRFLDRLLRPVTRCTMQRTGFDDENDFAVKLHHFYQTGRVWTKQTLLATIHVKNFYAIAPHGCMAEVLEYFLNDHLATNSIEKISIVHLKNLVQLFLYNNIFAYGEKIYKCMKGSPTTMPLTETLANIYLCQWQKMLVQELKSREQFFGRYGQDIFLTWNGSEDEFRQLMKGIQERDTNIQLDFSIGSAVHYLNASVENRSGQLFSRVDHSKESQTYTLPYLNHHSIEDHSDWLRFALFRAVCYSTSVQDFIRERLYLELSYLTNGYTLYYVEQRIDHFFNYFNMFMMRYNCDQKLYDRFRSQIFAFVERRQTLMHKIYRYEDDRKLFHFHYNYEYGSRWKFNETFHRLWTQYFKQHRVLSIDNAMIMLTTKHQYSLNVFLGQPSAFFRTLTIKKS